MKRVKIIAISRCDAFYIDRDWLVGRTGFWVGGPLTWDQVSYIPGDPDAKFQFGRLITNGKSGKFVRLTFHAVKTEEAR